MQGEGFGGEECRNAVREAERGEECMRGRVIRFV